jgi:hypothetical protein
VRDVPSPAPADEYYPEVPFFFSNGRASKNNSFGRSVRLLNVISAAARHAPIGSGKFMSDVTIACSSDPNFARILMPWIWLESF